MYEAVKRNLMLKLELLEEVLKTTAEQADLYKSDEIDPLMDSISKRQKLIDEIDRLDAETPESSGTGDGEVESLRSRIGEILTGIQEQDRANIKLATEQIEHYRGELEKGRKSVESAAAYMQHSYDAIDLGESGFDVKK